MSTFNVVDCLAPSIVSLFYNYCAVIYLSKETKSPTEYVQMRFTVDREVLPKLTLQLK